MRRCIFILFCACSILTALSAHETFNDDNIEVLFDDFPDNSLPDLEEFFEDEEDHFQEKELNDFTTRPDTSETIEQQSELGIDFHGFPSAIVNGCVNIMRGEYQESAIDFTLPGAMPLQMKRYYCGGKCEKHSFLYGWQLSHGAKLLCYKSKHRHDCAILKGSDRHGVFYQTPYHEEIYQSPNFFFKKGVTNCSLGEISAKTNFRNDYLFKHEGKIDLCTADRTRYRFMRSHGDPERESKTHGYRLELLELPDGNSYGYKYSHHFGMPVDIALMNRKGNITCGMKLKEVPKGDRFLQNPELTYITSTNEEITYRFKLYGKYHHHRAILSEVHPPHSPTIKYTYKPVREHVRRQRLVKKELPDSRCVEILYNDDDKVRTLLSPAGEGGELVVTHTFDYSKHGDMRYGEVKTALGGLKRYSWDKKRNRLNSIVTENAKGVRICKEKFRWGNDTKDESHMTARILEDAEGGLLAYQEYQYDAHGNLRSSALYGNLTGERPEPIHLRKSLKPPSKGKSEVLKTFWKYDALKRRIAEFNGRFVTRFAYLRDTDLVAAKYTSYDGGIKTRQFYRYDATGAVSQEITDNGSAECVDDLTDVTERLIKKIQNTSLGLPEIVEELAYDVSSGQQIALRKTVNQYDRHGWLVGQSIYDNEGNLAYTLEWQHDQHGNVIYEKNALGLVTTSQYDANDNLIYEQKPESAARHLTYDFMNRLILEEHVDSNGERLQKRFRYDAMGNCISKVDFYGHETLNTYDSLGRLVKTLYPTLDSQAYMHDALGRKNAIRDGNGNVTRISYNLRGKATETIYPDGSCEKQTYTIWGELAKTTARDGSSIHYTYDPQGREIAKEWFDVQGLSQKKISKTYDAFHLISETDANGIEIHYIYDYAGRLASKSIGNRKTLYGYDTLGRRSTTTQLLEEGSITFVEIFDALDHVIESYTVNSNGETSKRVLKDYDGQGHEIRRMEWNQAGVAITTNEYDQFGRIVCTVNPLGESTHTVYTINETPQQAVTDPLGITTVTTYDPLGQVAKEQRFDPMGQLVQQTDYAYDANGNKILRQVTTEKEPIKTAWEYDALNQLIKTTEATGTPEQRIAQRFYDNAGRLIKLIKNDGTALNYTYDSLGRRTSLKSSDGTLDYTYHYDNNDNLILAKDRINGLNIERDYDIHDQLIGETLPYGHHFQYTYDAIGNIKKVVLPDQTKISYQRCGDKLLSISREGANSYIHSYTSYDEANNPTSIKLAENAGTVNIAYDLLHRPISIQTPQWSENLAYQAHLLKQRTLKDTFGETESSYNYDAKDQILSEDGTAKHSFDYDWCGNPISYDGDERMFNSCNALLHDANRQFTYDLNGNRTSDGINHYHYDALDRLVEVSTPSGTYKYVYDPLGRRVSKHHEAEAVYYLWQKDQEIGTISLSGNIEELKILNPCNRAIAIELNGNMYVPIHDIFGHVRALFDKDGNCVGTYRYSAFGGEQIEGVVLSPWRYAGKRFDNETGFIYFGERYYDSSTLCWLNPDPMEDADGPNLYAYVHNNPLFFVDPDGCWSFGWFENPLANLALIAAEACAAATIIGWGIAGVAEGFLAGCSAGISGTAVDLALDAAALYSEGGMAICAAAEGSAISYNVCKTIGRVAGAAFSCTPAGKVTQSTLCTAKLGMGAVSTASSVVQGTKLAAQANKVAAVGTKTLKTAKVAEQSGQKLIGFIPKIEKGNHCGGLRHILKRHSAESTAKNASKFLPGMGEKEISSLVKEGCTKSLGWKIEENGMRSIITDMGKAIGVARDTGNQTNLLKIVLDGNRLYTTFPY